MKRYIILLLLCLMTAAYARAADAFKCKPGTIVVPDIGGVFIAEIIYDEDLPIGMLPIAPEIETMGTPKYDAKYVESISFMSKSQFKVTFKMRDKAEQITGTIRFEFYIKERDLGVSVGRSCELTYSYPAVTSLIGGVISAPEEEYGYGTRPSRIVSLMPAMTGYSRTITYLWQKKSGDGQWTDLPDRKAEDCYPDKIGYVSDYYRRVADDGYMTRSSNEVEIHASLNAGMIGIRYTDTSSTLTLTNEHSPSVEAARCTWESTTDLDTWTVLSGSGYSRSETKPVRTTYYRRAAASLDGESKSYSNTVCYNLSDPIYITTKTATDSLGSSNIEDRAYYDGLGRSCQTVNVGATPTGGDIVSVAVYDIKGREADGYLPFAVANGGGVYVRNPFYKQDEYYKTKYNGKSTLYPYTHREYDDSPLDRVMATIRPGAEYREGEGHSIRQSYGLNGEGEVLRIVLKTGGIAVDGAFARNMLYKTTLTDEDGAVSETYSDTRGRTILSRQVISVGNHVDTYYVYDEADRLRWVISPEGSTRLATGSSWSVTDENTAKYCYRYFYDGNGNVKIRYIPGRAPECIEYDAAGRIVASQNGAMREEDFGFAYEYDSIGRLTRVVIKEMTLQLDDGAPADPTEPGPTDPDPIDPVDPVFPPRDPKLPIIDPVDPGKGKPDNPRLPNDTIRGDIRLNFVPVVIKLPRNTELYMYDAYDLTSSAYAGHEFIPVAGVADSSLRAASALGLKTHEQIFETVGANALAPRLNVASSRRTFYYDKRNRVIQSVETTPANHYVRVSFKYDYTGNPLIRHEEYMVGADTTTVEYGFAYDHRGRLTHETVTVDGVLQTDMTNTYDDLGRFSSVVAANKLKTSHTYNIQGWLTRKSTWHDAGRIPYNPNDDFIQKTASDATPVSRGIGDFADKGIDFSGTIFEQNLKYFDATKTTPLYSGNIAENHWKQGRSSAKSYAYTYDSMGRLTDSKFSSSILSNRNIYGEYGIAYDKNGNILNLVRRNGVDDISRYEYALDGNRLATAGISTGTVTNNMGLYSDPTFSDPTTASFDYDTMGNMTYDGENSLHYSYNYLNLPNKVTRQDTTSSAATELILVKYKYLWDGTKVRAVNAEGVGYEYMGSLRFTVDGDSVEVESIPFSGGRILRTSAGYEPKYYVTDHLGSTRAIVNQDGKTVEAIFDYMPYGTEHTYASSPTAGTDYRFTGKERQDFFNMEDIYDSQARYQSISGRFMTIDPLAEKYYSISPYVYCAGNPVRYIDPNGGSLKDVIHGLLIGVVTNFTGDNSLRDSYIADDPHHYNNALQAADVGTIAIGATMTIIGGGEITEGVVVGVGGTAASLGAASPVTIPLGTVMVADGLVKIGSGIVLMGNAQGNLKGDYNYGQDKNISSEKNKETNPKSINQLNQSLKNKSRATKGIKRFDKGKLKGEQDHVHFENGSALNRDGSWKHGNRELTKDEIKFLRENGWHIE